MSCSLTGARSASGSITAMNSGRDDVRPLGRNPTYSGRAGRLANIANMGEGCRSLADAWADTTTAHGRLMFSALGGLAELERDMIRTRTTEGPQCAKANGVKMGRPPKLTTDQKKEAINRRDHGEETLAEIGRSYNLSRWTISRLQP